MFFQYLECYVDTKVKGSCSQSAGFRVTIFPAVEGANVLAACGQTDTVYHESLGPFLRQVVTDGDVVQTNETAVVDLIDASSQTCIRTCCVQAAVVVGRIVGCPVFAGSYVETVGYLRTAISWFSQ